MSKPMTYADNERFIYANGHRYLVMDYREDGTGRRKYWCRHAGKRDHLYGYTLRELRQAIAEADGKYGYEY